MRSAGAHRRRRLSQVRGDEQGERQHLVWQRVIDTLSSEDSVAIEFIFTYSPSEQARLDRGEAEEAQD